MDDERAGLRRRIGAQCGVFTREQARACGYSGDAIRRRLRSGEWVGAGKGVLRVADRPADARSRVFAVMLSLGPAATLVGTSAIWWWRFTDTPPAVIEVVMPPGSGAVPRPGVRLRRRAIRPPDRVAVDGVMVTRRATSLLDAVIDLGLAAGSELIDRALLGGRVTLAALRDAQTEICGRPGAETVRRVLALAAGGARFEAERRTHTVLREAGITGWSANHEVHVPGYGSALPDLAFLRERVVIEIDGWVYHRDQRAFVRDEARQNALTAAGWTVIRTNWHELTTRPEAFLAVVRAVLEARSARLRGHAV